MAEIEQNLFRGPACNTCHVRTAGGALPLHPTNLDLGSPGLAERMVDQPSESNPDKGKCPGRVLVPRNRPTDGLLVEKVMAATCGDRMPQALPALNADQISCVKRWAILAAQSVSGPVDAMDTPDAADAAVPDAAADVRPAPPDEADGPAPVDAEGIAAPTFCSLGREVPGASVPAGFCLRRFASVIEARTLTIAPNGDLFVGAPSAATPGGSSGGPGAIVVLSDDDHDGVAEVSRFAEGLDDVHGIAIGDGYVYFSTISTIWRTPYTPGLRKEMGPRESLGLPARYGQGGRWTHGLARSVAGRLHTSRAQYGLCGGTAGGEISVVTMGNMNVVARGFRNPMYLRCHHQDELCAATELGEDGSPGAKEKLIGLRLDTDYGYGSCCNGRLSPAPTATGPCNTVTAEDASFPLNDTPFGFDWERDSWPAPYKGGIFVALHGSFYSSPPWAGARIVYAHTDPGSHMPVENWRDFVTGFGPMGGMLKRPSDVAFASDGRMFFSDDQGGAIYWAAPESLRRPN
jgi:glucose/arabinose dehydrogenase